MLKLVNELKQLDEITVLELLEITSAELVDAFMDKVEEKEGWLSEQVGTEAE